MHTEVVCYVNYKGNWFAWLPEQNCIVLLTRELYDTVLRLQFMEGLVSALFAFELATRKLAAAIH